MDLEPRLQFISEDRTPANTPPRLYIPPNIYTPANGPLFQAEPRDLEREDLLRQIDVFRQRMPISSVSTISFFLQKASKLL